MPHSKISPHSKLFSPKHKNVLYYINTAKKSLVGGVWKNMDGPWEYIATKTMAIFIYAAKLSGFYKRFQFNNTSRTRKGLCSLEWPSQCPVKPNMFISVASFSFNGRSWGFWSSQLLLSWQRFWSQMKVCSLGVHHMQLQMNSNTALWVFISLSGEGWGELK